MGFRENLKAQLQFADMLVKELAIKTGIKKTTLDSYLRINGYTPSIEAGVKIAQALGVTVEYLVNGNEVENQKSAGASSAEALQIFTIANQLEEKDRYRLLEIAKIFKKTTSKLQKK